MRVTSHEVPYVRHPVDLSIPVRYLLGPDSSAQPGVPRGTVVNFALNESELYPGKSRTVWVHVPARYDPSEPAALMVFQDGALYLDPTGEMRAGIVLDNLMHRGEMPVTLGVFVDPGQPGNRNAATRPPTRSTLHRRKCRPNPAGSCEANRSPAVSPMARRPTACCTPPHLTMGSPPWPAASS